MKAFLLTAALAITCSGSLFAQKDLWQNFPPDIKWDLGVNYGASIITRPQGPENDYTGSKTKVVPDFSVCVQYAVTPHWHVMLDVGSRKWESTGTWQEPYVNNTSLKPQQVTFLIGKPVISESIKLNYAIPFYSGYNEMNRANLTFGVMAGLVQAINDGSVGYSKYNAQPDSSYQYVSSIHYASAIGFSVGVQVGYTYYLTQRLGVSVELAARYVNMGATTTNGLDYTHEYDKYKMLFLPETFGIRYRFR